MAKLIESITVTINTGRQIGENWETGSCVSIISGSSLVKANNINLVVDGDNNSWLDYSSVGGTGIIEVIGNSEIKVANGDSSFKKVAITGAEVIVAGSYIQSSSVSVNYIDGIEIL